MKHEAIIFDMDGVLIDSEGFWATAEREVFGALGVPLTTALAKQTATMTTAEVTKFWYELAPWPNRSLAAVENDVIDYVEAQIRQKGKAIEGIENVLELFFKGGFKIGLATNAPYRLVPVVLEKLKISRYFSVLSAAEFEAKGKPDPAIYLHTANKLQLSPSACIVVEDSRSGLIAAKKAGMTTVFLDRLGSFDNSMSELVDLRITSFAEFIAHQSLLPPSSQGQNP